MHAKHLKRRSKVTVPAHFSYGGSIHEQMAVAVLTGTHGCHVADQTRHRRWTPSPTLDSVQRGGSSLEKVGASTILMLAAKDTELGRSQGRTFARAIVVVESCNNVS